MCWQTLHKAYECNKMMQDGHDVIAEYIIENTSLSVDDINEHWSARRWYFFSEDNSKPCLDNLLLCFVCINHDTKHANTFRKLNMNIDEINHIKRTLRLLLNAAADDDGFKILEIQRFIVELT